jgi:hypothetical protein
MQSPLLMVWRWFHFSPSHDDLSCSITTISRSIDTVNWLLLCGSCFLGKILFLMLTRAAASQQSAFLSTPSLEKYPKCTMSCKQLYYRTMEVVFRQSLLQQPGPSVVLPTADTSAATSESFFDGSVALSGRTIPLCKQWGKRIDFQQFHRSDGLACVSPRLQHRSPSPCLICFK